MVRIDETVIFVYSDMQLQEAKEINRKNNRNFSCGEVSIGSSAKRYSKIIREEDLKAMCAQYPDTVIVCQGRLRDFKYTPINEDYITA